MDPQQGPAQPDFLIGQTIGNYRVTEKLGEGGMGSVYLALHPHIGKKVALKVLHAEFSNNQDIASRFFNEAKAVNDIGHPNIVDVVDFGIIQAGTGNEQLVYFIMEYLAGMTLSQLIRAEAPLPPERALTIGLQVADALSASHKCQIVHRDLKPDNIILVQRGRERDFVKLLDFGIAKLTGGDRPGSQRTRTGLVMGTPAYMSPEQCEGRADVDKRTDIYALGIVMYEMLTGRVPFVGEGYGEILVQHLTQPPTPVSRFRMLPAHVEAVVMKALEKRPDMRYPDMDELMRAMSDPVGYVEAHGGVGEFAKRQLMPSNAPLPSVRLTPAPLTPAPGAMMSSQVATPAPTTMSSAAGSRMGMAAPATQSRTGMYVAAGIGVVVAAIVAIVIVVTGKDKLPATGSNTASDGSAKVAVETGSGSSAGSNPGSSADSSGSAVAANAGSGSAVAANAGSGSAVTANTGSGSTQPTIPEPGSGSAAGSAAGSNAGSGTGSQTVAEDEKVDIDVVSTPAGARIYIDGVDTGKSTPATLNLPKTQGKKVNVSLKLKSYMSFSSRVDVGQSSQQRFELTKIGKSTTTTPPPPPPPPGNRNGSATPTRPQNQDPDGLMRP